jgi:nucleoside-diphosphate-sugar epimerase
MWSCNAALASFRILVTGPTGFIGRYVLEQLVRNEDVDITAIARPGAVWAFTNNGQASRVNVVVGDLSNPYTLRLPLRDYDAVINVVGPRSSLPRAQWESNVEYIRNLLIVLRRVQVQRIVHFSSVSVHGAGPGGSGTMDESASLAPGDWYGSTKLMGEQLLRRFHRETGVPVTILRPSWVVGSGSHLLDRYLFRAFSSGLKIVMRLGTPLNAVYVRDVADAAILAALGARQGFSAYIINAAQQWSFDDLLKEIDRAVARPKLPVVIPKALVGMLARRYGSLKLILSGVMFSSDRAREELGFVPRYDLRAMVEETLMLRASVQERK